MIPFEKFYLDNGLTVVFSKDDSSPLVAFNIIYKIGSKYENPKRTGWAHLLEHLMFESADGLPSYDQQLELAGAINNAFTNEDFTSYYVVIPKENFELVLWLEANRMKSLNIDKKSLEIQKSVVIEEFKQVVLNQPYEDIFHILSKLAYKKHPYQWTTIGKKISHIRKANLKEILKFYKNFYAPNNAIISIVGNFEVDEVRDLVTKYFSNIPPSEIIIPTIVPEPPQKARRFIKVRRNNIPQSRIYMAFHYGDRKSKEFYICDLITDILDAGKSSRFFKNLVKEKQLFTELEAFITGSIDPGLLIIYGQPVENISLQDAENYIWEEIYKLHNELVDDDELIKTINSLEYSHNIIKANIHNKAYTLAYYELLQDAGLINSEIDIYKQITKHDIQQFAKQNLIPSKSNVVYYCKK